MRIRPVSKSSESGPQAGGPGSRLRNFYFRLGVPVVPTTMTANNVSRRRKEGTVFRFL